MQESGENYLETILLLQKKKGYVRSIDIANELGFTKPSISRAMGILKTAGYIEVGDGGAILLTSSGRIKAEEIYERHRLITKFLVDTLALDEEIASQDACKIEHILSKSALNAIKERFNYKK